MNITRNVHIGVQQWKLYLIHAEH